MANTTAGQQATPPIAPITRGYRVLDETIVDDV
jgi:hypothetical protein